MILVLVATRRTAEAAMSASARGERKGSRPSEIVWSHGRAATDARSSGGKIEVAPCATLVE